MRPSDFADGFAEHLKQTPGGQQFAQDAARSIAEKQTDSVADALTLPKRVRELEAALQELLLRVAALEDQI